MHHEYGRPRCAVCSADMIPGKGKPATSSVAIGLLVMLVGLALLVVFPLGTLIGLGLIIYGAVRGSSKQPGLRCVACRHFIPIR